MMSFLNSGIIFILGLFLQVAFGDGNVNLIFKSHTTCIISFYCAFSKSEIIISSSLKIIVFEIKASKFAYLFLKYVVSNIYIWTFKHYYAMAIS